MVPQQDLAPNARQSCFRGSSAGDRIWLAVQIQRRPGDFSTVIFLVGLSPAILLFGFSARMYMVYMLFCTLAIVLSVFWRPMKWDRKRLLYLLTLLAASFSSEHPI